MFPQKQTLDAATNAPWMPVNFRVTDFGVGVGVVVSEDGDLTYSVQFAFDSPYLKTACSLSRSGSTATATFKEPHGHKVGDSAVISGTIEENFVGTFDVAAVPTPTTFTFSVTSTGATSTEADAVLLGVFTHEDLLDQTESASAGFVLPPSVMRLSVSDYTAGMVTANYTILARG